MDWIFSADNAIILWIQRVMPDSFVSFFSLITEFGDEFILVGLCGLFYWSLNKEIGKKLLVRAAFTTVLNPFLKCVVKRPRPYMENHEIRCLKPVSSDGDLYDIVTQGYSFPSGHSSNSMTSYLTLASFARHWVWKCLLALLILLVGVSRFALGVHYPSDVLAGWVISLIAITVCDLLEKKLGRPRAFLLLNLLGLTGFAFVRINEFFTGYGLLLGGTMGVLLDEKVVHFPETRNPLLVLLRTVLGVGLFLGLNSLLKLPFSAEFLNNGTLGSFTVRALRYAIVSFVGMGLYPMCFHIFEKRTQVKEE